MEKAFAPKLMGQKLSEIDVLPIHPFTLLTIKMRFRKKCNDINKFVEITEEDLCFATQILKEVKFAEDYLNEKPA